MSLPKSAMLGLLQQCAASAYLVARETCDPRAQEHAAAQSRYERLFRGVEEL